MATASTNSNVLGGSAAHGSREDTQSIKTIHSVLTATSGDPDIDPNWKPFPDYLVVGQINLNKSKENAATLARHIAKQWDFYRVNSNGIISSQQLEINRDPDKYGGKRNGKPLTVTEWKQLQKEKLDQQVPLLADLEKNKEGKNNPRGRGGQRGLNRGRGSGKDRGSVSGRRGGRGRGTHLDLPQPQESVSPVA